MSAAFSAIISVAALVLAETMVGIGNRSGVRTVALLTRMDHPLGRAVGNTLEVDESIDVLNGGGPADVIEVTVALAREMVALAGLGVDPGEAVKRVARLACAGGAAQARKIAAYEGTKTCAESAVIAGAGKGCSWGCLGLADCEVSCTFDAIRMNRNGLPVVDVDKCTACGDCVDACPRDLFTIRPLLHPVIVQIRGELHVATRIVCVLRQEEGRRKRGGGSPLAQEGKDPARVEEGGGGPQGEGGGGATRRGAHRGRDGQGAA